MSGGLTRWPFSGRDEELEVCRSALRSGRGVVLGGGQGVGKTRLALELAELASADGAVVERTGAAPGTADVPLGAFARHLGAQAVDAGDAGVPFALRSLQHLHRVMAETADGGRLVLVVDDAQWLDDLSATFVVELAASGIPVIATVRTGLLAPSGIGRLWKEEYCDRIELQPLSRSDVEALLTSALGPIGDDTITDLWRATEGYPLMLRELTAAAVDSGALRQLGGRWQWDGTVAAGPRLAELIDDRLGTLTDDERRGVAAIAFGEPLSLEAALELMTVSALADLEARGIVSGDAFNDKRVRLAHPLYGEVVRARLGPLEAAEVKRRLADAMHTAGTPTAIDRLRGVLWALDGGAEPSVDAIVTASDIAHDSGDVALSERLARAAVDRGGGLAAQTARARAFVMHGRFSEAVPLLTEVLSADDATDTTRAAGATWLIAALAYGQGRIDDARPVVAAALERVEDDVQRALIAGEWAAALSHVGRWAEAYPVAAPLLEHADLQVRVRALQAAHIALLAQGESAQAAAKAAELLPSVLASRQTFPGGPRWVFGSLITADLLDARLHEVGALLDQVRFDVQTRGPNASYLALARGRYWLARGRPATALAELAAAAEGLRVADPMGWNAMTHALLAEAATLVGDASTAADAVKTAEAAPAGARFARYDTQRALAWGTAASDRQQALERIKTLFADASSTGAVPFQMLALRDAVRLGGSGWAASALPSVTVPWKSGWTRPIVDLIEGARAADGATLERSGEGFEALGADLQAAEAFAAAAVTYREHGLNARAAKAGRRCSVAASRCEGARAPLLERHHEGPVLTIRERDVALLAVRGLASREIGDRLGISPRTVDNLLGRVYSKLGISSRSELAHVIGPDGFDA